MLRRCVVLVCLGLAACGAAPTSGPAGQIRVVAAENFWGSIATQLGGSKAAVQSVVTDPNADPHEYESNANDARAFADAGLVILNGAGYDVWGGRLLSANPGSHRTVLVASDLLGKRAGDNPHLWYDPGAVERMADAITGAYKALDPADASVFDQARAAFAVALAPYHAEIASIRQRHAGAPIGATESIFMYMATALGLNLTTPPAFMEAVAAGSDPPAGAVATFQDQLAGNQVKVLVYDVQAPTAVTTAIRQLAAAHHIPNVGVSETLQPANVSFQDWQLGQLERLDAALAANL